jgi:uncharacterized protein with ParB-like and HNH nuclease domain
MDLHAYTKSIADILSVNKKYVVPRFQREYSWKKEQVLELWDDVLLNIKAKTGGTYSNTEYFIGSLVLVGEDASFIMQIVDGQQRLTTITVMLSALFQTLTEVGETSAATALYEQYIEGKDAENKPYFKLINETPKPFFQRAIQDKIKEKLDPETNEEKSLFEAYSELYRYMSLPTVKANFTDFKKLGKDDHARHINFLKALRDQILRYLKVIYITVRDEDDAYTIFETLNARGMSLSAVDLVKNIIFKELNLQHPDDYAKTEWEKIKTRLTSRKENLRVDTFFRHFWLSKYGFTSEGRIYKSFRKLLQEGAFDTNKLLKELVENATLYNKIANPLIQDWPQQEEKDIYYSLDALNLFKVTQTRSLIMSLFRKRNQKKIGLTELVKILRNLENFHFVFTAICSSRASGIEGKYSRAARDIEQATTKQEVHAILKDLNKFLKDKLPSLSIFLQNIEKLEFLSGQDKDKKLIQYLFGRMEKSLHNTEELRIDRLTLEHIHPQYDIKNNPKVAKLGNLLPLDKKLNGIVDTSPVDKKMKEYAKSELKIVKSFVTANKTQKKWDESRIDKRTESIGNSSYSNTFTIVL